MTNLIELDKKHFIHPTSSIKQQQSEGPKMIVDKGEGIYLMDREGNTYIDGMSSLWNVNVGHGRKELAEAGREQMEKLAFSSSFSSFSNEPAIKLTEKLASISPSGINAAFLTSGGSESNDSVIKLVRYYWKLQGKPERRKIISLRRGYHGVAAASTSATGIPEFWDMAGHMESGFAHARSSYEIGTEKSIQSIREVIEREGSENVAAFMAEPVQGAGGVLIPAPDYFKEVKKLCEEYGILLIADEVITGFGRTGTMFGMENWGVIPDLMTFAKGVSSGYIPLGGVMVSDHVHDVLKNKSEGTLFHGFTYSGHPTAAAVGLKNIEMIEEEGLVDNASRMGDRLLQGFQGIKEDLKIVGNVRAIGLLGAVEIVQDVEANKRFPAERQVAPRIIEKLHERGLICRSVSYENTDIICVAPPLIINGEQVDAINERIHDAILDMQKELGV